MALPDGLKTIAGVQELHEWFGYWPTFHDAEIVSLHLNRTSPSVLTIHTWETTNEVDKAGYYVLAKDVVVEFILDISGDDDSLELYGFSHQNVIMSLAIDKVDSRYQLTLEQCYGLAGTIKSNNISIRLTPGKPGDRHEDRPSVKSRE
jgi:Immunity protein 50